MTETSAGFSGLGLVPKLLTILDQLKFTIPTPIQHQAIPVGITGQDMLGIAQTGTGKTLAFGLPLVQRLQEIPGNGLILVPTRELALQVDETIQKIGRPLGIGTAVFIGGESFGRQVDAVRRQPRIIIATPGRLIDHLEQKTIKLDNVKILVLDEADRMFDMGFAPQLKRIFQAIPKERQTLLFSATMPSEIVKTAATHMKMPVRIEVAPQGTSAEKVEQEIIFVGKDSKIHLLENILRENQGTVLVFSRTKHGAKKICRSLNIMGYTAAEIHANRSQSQRKEALAGFKSGKYRVLVATDIAARGIDVKNIEMVINFDLPDNSEDYVHRIGRTGRAGHAGRAISFATADQKRDVRDIEKLIRKTLTVIVKAPETPPASVGKNIAIASADSERRRPMNHRRPSSGGKPENPFRQKRRNKGNYSNSARA